ncbi:MAG: aminoacyl-tRNA hydrolase [Lachnospiraceae bacterium]|jgi:PTH1 family peptidyl-tRNA hydrolase|nr:aminoacyl-tRNA hydrolase [Lachnospiraceae bacterium]
MYLIVGLGNPEPEYSDTRHNIGFDVINKFAKKNDIELNKTKYKGLYGTGVIKNEKVVLLKPQTYMNLSGQSVIEFKKFYKLETDKIILVYDDIDLEIGKIRIRKKGTAGTHNGMKSVVENLQSENFARVRIGVGSPEYKNDLINFLLAKISVEDKNSLTKSIDIAAEAIFDIIENGAEFAMNKYN